MPRLTRAQQETRRQLKHLAGSGLASGPLGDRILQALDIAIPADGAALLGVDSDTWLFNRVIALAGNGLEEILFWLRHVYLAREPDIGVTFPELMAGNLPVIVIGNRREDCWGLPAMLFDSLKPGEFSKLYHDSASPAGGVLRASFASNGRKIAALQIARDEKRHPFTATDGAFLRRLVPMIGRILGAALSREWALMNLDGPPLSSGILVLAHNGSVTLQTPVVETWFDALKDFDVLTTNRAVLPTPVWAAVAALRAAQDSGVASAALRVPTSLGTLRVEASAARDDGSTAVVLIPELPPSSIVLPPIWPLTPRERDVLSLVVRGLSNRQIADRLSVSENTVESHLSHAFEKLAVGSRTQFLALLFREAYWPLQQSD